jgi:hypothetical protein
MEGVRKYLDARRDCNAVRVCWLLEIVPTLTFVSGGRRRKEAKGGCQRESQEGRRKKVGLGRRKVPGFLYSKIGRTQRFTPSSLSKIILTLIMYLP